MQHLEIPKFFKIGHRGAPGHDEHENTMCSFGKAITLGANALEFDVWRTIDGVLVAIHDPTLERTTNGFGTVQNKLWSHLKILDAGKGKQIPILRQIFEEFGGKVFLNIEIKQEDIVEDILALVRKYELEDSVLISGFNHTENEPGASSNWDDLLKIKRMEPRIQIALLVESEENLEAAIALASAVKSLYPVFAINPPVGLIIRELIERIHAMGLRALPYTANDPEEIARLKKIGVDGLFSDYPDRL